MLILRSAVIAALLMAFSVPGIAAEVKLKADVDEFIFEKAPFEQCHASTIVELPNGDLLAAWFAGQHEGDKTSPSGSPASPWAVCGRHPSWWQVTLTCPVGTPCCFSTPKT